MKMKTIFSLSKDGRSEYCCSVVKIGTLKHIENSDFLAETIINGQTAIVRKDQVKEGDLMFYAPNETQLSKKFLSRNNLFDIGHYYLNSNKKEVKDLLNTANKLENELLSNSYKEQAKKKCGFFSANGRVRMIKLKKRPSYGYLFTVQEMINFCPKTKNINMEDYLNVDFDTVNGDIFIQPYIPPLPKTNEDNGLSKKHKSQQKKIDKYDRMIAGEFFLHYDTKPLGKNLELFSPEDSVTISVKLHGTSFILANVKTKEFIKLPLCKRVINFIIDNTKILKKYRFKDYKVVYDNIYSSRTVIKNRTLNPNVSDGFYNTDIWKEYHDLLEGKVKKGITLYGEIVGYISDSNKFIQSQYDYGCKVGENKLMPYRITSSLEDGSKYEWTVNEVKQWTENLINDYPTLKNKIITIPILYHGNLKDLYPNLDIQHHWHENLMELLKNDKEHFGMELLEPLCKNKVYREGICIRKNNDTIAECFKLKTDAFFTYEQKAIDKGNVDIEMNDNYSN